MGQYVPGAPIAHDSRGVKFLLCQTPNAVQQAVVLVRHKPAQCRPAPPGIRFPLGPNRTIGIPYRPGQLMQPVYVKKIRYDSLLQPRLAQVRQDCVARGEDHMVDVLLLGIRAVGRGRTRDGPEGSRDTFG